VITNDPENKKRELVITGMVEKFADISPARFRLSGKAGKLIERTIKIKPRKKYPFIIKKVVSTNKSINCSLSTMGEGQKTFYAIRVETTQMEKGRFKGKLILTTTSKLKPELEIDISGKIR